MVMTLRINKILLILVVAGITLGLFTSGISQAKTLTNADIEKIKGQQNKGVPTHGASENPDVPPPPTADTDINQSGGSGTGGGAPIVKKYLPYKDWEDDYRDYFAVHYHDPSLKLDPKLVVLHYSGTPNFATLWWTYMKGKNYKGGDGSTKTRHFSAHFAVDRDGTIYELMPLNRRTIGSYGVNHKAINIEIIGQNEKEILSSSRQMKVTFALVKWLMRRYKISSAGVRAHTEIARGKELVPEYTDYADKQYPDKYPPGSNPRGPGKTYMFKLRYYLHEPR